MFYAVERFVDGFGADTWVDCIFKTEKDAQKYIDKILEGGHCNPGDIEIIPCKFGEPIEQFWG